MSAETLKSLPDSFRSLAALFEQLTSITPNLQLSNRNEIALIQKTVDIAVALIAELKAYRNSVTPLFHLPDEIMAEIFFQVMIDDPWSTESWTRLLFVCRRWNKICYSDCRLWSWIEQGWSPRLRRLLKLEECSRGYPLALKLSNSDFAFLLDRNAQRIHLLELNGLHKDFYNIFEDITELPMLETLHLAASRSMDEQGPLLYVPSFISQGGSPHLRRLTLDNVAFRYIAEFLHLSNLTHLELSKHILDSSLTDLPSFNNILMVLSQSPRLHSLTIRHYVAIPSIFEGFFTNTEFFSISLPDLRHLDLNMETRAIIKFLQVLKLPPTTRTSFIAHPSSEDSLIDEFKDLLVPVRRHLRQPGAPVLRSALLDALLGVSESRFVSFSASTESVCPDDYYWRDSDRRRPHIRLLTYPMNQPELRKLLAKLLDALPLENLEHFDVTRIQFDEKPSEEISGLGHMSSATWKTVFRHLPPHLTIKIGLNPGLHAMLDGAIDTLHSYWDYIPSSRTKRRLEYTCGGNHPITKLIISAFRQHRGSEINDAFQRSMYERLVSQLAIWRDLYTPLKPKDAPLQVVALEDMTRGYIHGFAYGAKLYEVTDEVSLEGRVWTPEGDRKSRRRMRKLRRRMEKKYSLKYPPEFENSPLSSDTGEENS